MSNEEDNTEQSPSTVLIVEDEPGLADLYSVWLSEEHDVKTAYSGSEALEKLDHSIDVVLLDRRMPGLSGDEALEEIRDRGIDCQIAMVTAVAPDGEIADFPIDDYLLKPIERDRLVEVVDELLLRLRGPPSKQELLALISRKIALEKEHQKIELEDNQDYIHLTRRIEKAMAQFEFSSQRTSSKHRPSSCPECDLRWDISVEDALGFIDLASRVYKCTRCGVVIHQRDPTNQRIARR